MSLLQTRTVLLAGISLGALLSATVAPSVTAQPLEIVSTDPPEDATGVPLRQVVTFNLSKPTPAFGSGFTTKFTWSPTDSTVLTTFGHDFDGNGQLTIIFFTLDHTSSTDFAFFAYGIQAADGSTMERPLALNYTTASTRGSHSVDGGVAFGGRTSSSSARANVLGSLIRRSLLHRTEAGGTGLSASSKGVLRQISVARLEEFDRSSVAAAESARSTRMPDDIRRTVVLLLEQYDLNEERWHFHSAAVPDDGGAFTLDQVRDGTYVPVALNFADATGTSIGSYGFYDPDGDLEPNSIVLAGTDASGVDMTLFPNQPFSAAANLALARDVAGRYAPDQELIDLRVLSGPDFGVVFDDGSAMVWRYMFFSPSQAQITVVAVDPINFYVDTFSYLDVPPATIPGTIVDSGQAIQIADAAGGDDFRAGYSGAAVTVFMQGGDLDLLERPAPGKVFWKVEYRSPDGFPTTTLTVFVDIETGEVLSPGSVGTEQEIPSSFRLHQNYPNPFNPSTRIEFDLGTGGFVTLDVFDLLGRRMETLYSGPMPAGRHSVVWTSDRHPSGVYLYRLAAGGHRFIRSMTLLR